MSNPVKFGAIKFKSITAAAKAAQKKNPELKFMTIYMRLRAGKPVGSALQMKPRKYVRRQPVEVLARLAADHAEPDGDLLDFLESQLGCQTLANFSREVEAA